MTVPPELIAAYNRAVYVVFSQPEVVFRIGVSSPEIHSILNNQTGAFLTAANPRSQKKSAAENAAALAALDREIAGYRTIPGEGREPDGSWREPSRLVIGIGRAEAAALGRRFGQNAIVFIEPGAAPELMVLF